MRGAAGAGPLVAALGLLALAPLGVAGQGGHDPVRTTGAPEVLGSFDYDWSVRTLEGAEVSLEAHRGDVLVVNFWATWCAPCVAELGSFARLIGMLGEAAVAGPDTADLGSDSDRSARIRFLFVSPEDPGRVERFAHRYGRGLDLVTEARRAPASLGDLVLPTTLVVAPGGDIVLRHRGASEWAQPGVARFLRAIAGGS